MHTLFLLLLFSSIACASQHYEQVIEHSTIAKKRKKDLLDVVTEITAIQDIIRAYLTEWQTILTDKHIPRRVHSALIEAEQFSPDSTKIAILYQNIAAAKLRIFDLTKQIFITFTIKGKKYLIVHDNRAHALDYSPDGSQIATGAWEPDGRARMWDAKTGICVHTINLGNNAIHQVKYSPNGAYLALTGKKNALLKTGDFTQVGSNLCTDSQLMDRAFFSRDSRLVAFASKHKNVVHIFETHNSVRVQVIKHPTQKAKIFAILFSADNKQIIIAAQTETPDGITIWDTQTGKHIRTLDHAGYAYHLAQSPTEHIFATGESNTQTIKIWDAQNYALRKTYSASFTGPIDEVVFSQDGKYIGGTGAKAFMWSIRTDDLISHADTTNHLAKKFSGDFKNIAVHCSFKILQAITPNTTE